jgi:hypothetical protein
MSSVPTNQFQGLLTCAEMLHSQLTTSTGEAALDAVLNARALLSHVAATALSEMPLEDIASVISGCASALNREELLRDVVIDGLRNGMMHSLQSCDSLSDSFGFQMQEAEAFITNIMVLIKHEIFGQLMEDMSVYAARQVFDAVKVAPLEKLPAMLRRAEQLIARWTSAKLEYTMAVRHWLTSRLQQLLAKVSSFPEPSSPSVLKQSPGRTPVWMQAPWWLDVLRAAAVVGLLEGTPLRELCDGVLPLLTNEGIKVATSQAILLSMQSPTKGCNSLATIGHDIAPGMLARELLTRPALLRFMPNVPLIVLNCPSDGNAMESVTLSCSGLGCETSAIQKKNVSRATSAPTR